MLITEQKKSELIKMKSWKIKNKKTLTAFHQVIIYSCKLNSYPEKRRIANSVIKLSYPYYAPTRSPLYILQTRGLIFIASQIKEFLSKIEKKKFSFSKQSVTSCSYLESLISSSRSAVDSDRFFFFLFK